jgi:hypothetical protein
MIRNLKALSLAVIAVFAMSALAASAAQAAPEITAVNGKYPVTVDATSTKTEFTAGAAVKCASNTFTGSLSKASGELSITHTVTNPCTAGGLPATITFNGCTYLFRNLTLVAAGHYNSLVDIVCPAGKQIEVHIYTSSKHTTTLCTIDIPGQKGLGPVTLINNAATTDINASGSIAGITYEETGAFCPAPGHHTNAVFDLGTVAEPLTLTGSEPIHISG